MTIKQNGGIFGRNPEFNDVSAKDVSVTDEITILENGVDVGGVRSLSGQAQLSGTTTGITFGAQSVLPTNGGSAIQNGTRDIGGASNFWRNVYVSTGVYFGSQTTATHLDDYEEGSWTPDVQDSSGNSASTSSAAGAYTKVGDLVTAFMRIVDVNKTGLTSGDAIRVYGLPYTGIGTTRYGGSAIINTWTGTTGLITQVIGGNTYVQFKTSSNGNALVSEITSGSADIYAQVTYKV